MAEGELAYESVQVGLRAPRVAIVFDASGEAWDFFARLAIWQANQFWGGAGFILIPHSGGVVSEMMLRTAVEYDPDYVVASHGSVADLEALRSGWIPEHFGAKTALAPDEINEINEVLKQAGSEEVLDVGTETARSYVASACSPHRRLMDDLGPDEFAGREWDEEVVSLDVDERAVVLHTSPLTAVWTFQEPTVTRLAARPEWAGPWGLAVAARAGMVRRPDPSAPPFVPQTPAVFSQWFFDHDRPPRGLPADVMEHPGDIALSVLPEQQPVAWERTTTGLVRVRSRATMRSTRHLVVGDGPDDFALAFALQRMYGIAVWLHSAWDPTTVTDEVASASLMRAWIQGSDRFAGSVRVVSATVDEEVLEKHRGLLASHAEPWAMSRGTARRSRSRDAVAVERGVNWDRRGQLHLALVDRYNTTMPVPARIGDDDTVSLMTPVPGVLPSNPTLLSNPAWTWQVDAQVDANQMVSGHGLDGHRMEARGPGADNTWIRPSRAGVTFHSIRHSFVGSWEDKEQTLARPQLQFLGLESWVRALADQRGLETRFSETGRRAHILARLWGSRIDLVHDVAGPMWGALEKFSWTGKSTPLAYPDGDGVLVPGIGGVLTFDGIQAAWTKPIEVDELRDVVDSLLTRGIVRRGLVVSCPDCGHLAFVAIDDLRQHNVCPRCSATNSLDRPTWSSTPQPEPRWFYDLHGVARALIADNGHAPLWLAHYLSNRQNPALGRSSVATIAETDLLQRCSRKPSAEADLIGICDGTVITAEVKTSDTLGRSRTEKNSAARKRILWAQVLRADEIVLATTQPSWDTASVTAVRTARTQEAWAPGHLPRLRIITGLGSADVESHYHDR